MKNNFQKPVRKVVKCVDISSDTRTDMSVFFAFQLDLTACFCLHDTFVSRRKEKSLFLIVLDNQRVTTAIFCN